jgi:cytoskeletal protein RodZ
VALPETDWPAAIEKEPLRRGASIGDALAQGRRQAGLTITHVSKRTCIRETIIRGIERGDFSGCGGDFYARGHIRSIAGAVGVDPAPLIAEYDATMGAPQAISAADVFQPVTPVKLKERRRPNWTAAMALALVVIAGIFAYQHVASNAPAAAKTHVRVQSPSTASKPKVSTSPAAAHHRRPHRLHIRLTAVQNCWVQLIANSGATLFSGMVYAGNTMYWNEHHRVKMVLGNPSGVKVLVNGKNAIPRGSVSLVTLHLRANMTHKHG